MVAMLSTLMVCIAAVVAGPSVDGPLMAEITAVDAPVPDVSEVTYQQKCSPARWLFVHVVGHRR